MIGIGIAIIGATVSSIIVLAAGTVVGTVTIVMWTLIMLLAAIFYSATFLVNIGTLILEAVLVVLTYVVVFTLGIVGMVSIIYGIMKQEISFIGVGTTLQISFWLLITVQVLFNFTSLLYIYNITNQWIAAGCPISIFTLSINTC